jgi:hypothetical protein
MFEVIMFDLRCEASEGTNRHLMKPDARIENDLNILSPSVYGACKANNSRAPFAGNQATALEKVRYQSLQMPVDSGSPAWR